MTFQLLFKVKLGVYHLHLEFFLELWHRFEQISDQAKVGDLEDGCFGVLVDCHNRF